MAPLGLSDYPLRVRSPAGRRRGCELWEAGLRSPSPTCPPGRFGGVEGSQDQGSGRPGFWRPASRREDLSRSPLLRQSPYRREPQARCLVGKHFEEGQLQKSSLRRKRPFSMLGHRMLLFPLPGAGTCGHSSCPRAPPSSPSQVSLPECHRGGCAGRPCQLVLGPCQQERGAVPWVTWPVSGRCAQC